MSTRSIVASVLDRPGALERVVGLLRRRGFGAHRLSIGREDDGTWHLVIELDGDDQLGARICAGLESVVDVTSVRFILLPEEGREMVLAGVTADEPAADSSADGFHLITGSPAEVDRVLDRLRRSGKLKWSVRTGAVVPFPSIPSTGAGSPPPSEKQR